MNNSIGCNFFLDVLLLFYKWLFEATRCSIVEVWMISDFCDCSFRGVNFFAFSHTVCCEIGIFEEFFVKFTVIYDVVSARQYKIYTLVNQS